jgi:hypothetical protein
MSLIMIHLRPYISSDASLIKREPETCHKVRVTNFYYRTGTTEALLGDALRGHVSLSMCKLETRGKGMHRQFDWRLRLIGDTPYLIRVSYLMPLSPSWLPATYLHKQQ